MKKTPQQTPLSRRKIGLRPPWKPGESGNPAGRPKGTRNFKTVFIEATKEVAEARKLGKDPDKISVELIERGIKQFLKGKKKS